MKESKEERFRRVAETRVNKIIRMIRLLGNCSRAQTYACTEEQVKQIFSTLQTELDTARSRFSDTGRHRFSLSDKCEPTEKEDTSQIWLELPDGSCLHASACQDTPYPAINIKLLTDDGDSEELVCFAEFNPEMGPAGLLCIGAYRSDQDDTTYYRPYDAAAEER